MDHVDDLVVIGVDILSVNLIKSRLSHQFTVKGLEHVSELVGIALVYDKLLGNCILIKKKRNSLSVEIIQHV